MCDIDVVMSFLTLASMITMAVERESDDLITMLSSCWMWIFLLLSWCILNKLNENWSEKLSITLWPDENSE